MCVPSTCAPCAAFSPCDVCLTSVPPWCAFGVSVPLLHMLRYTCAPRASKLAQTCAHMRTVANARASSEPVGGGGWGGARACARFEGLSPSACVCVCVPLFPLSPLSLARSLSLTLSFSLSLSLPPPPPLPFPPLHWLCCAVPPVLSTPLLAVSGSLRRLGKRVNQRASERERESPHVAKHTMCLSALSNANPAIAKHAHAHSLASTANAKHPLASTFAKQNKSRLKILGCLFVNGDVTLNVALWVEHAQCH